MTTKSTLALLIGIAAGCSPKPAPTAAVTPALIQINANPKDKVDLLFMVDNSPSMDSMQSGLRAAFFEFFKPFGDLAARGKFVNFHIGVVTSDYGAGATGAPGCDPSPGGQRGLLQTLGRAAQSDCVPPVAARFIEYSTAPGGSTNVPVSQGLAATFTCMASVGAQGCGFEHQLESVFAALHNNDENAGFLRPDAALAVAFLTNEDDASAPPTTDVFDKNQTNLYGYQDSYSRQTRFAVQCCPPGAAACKEGQLEFPPYGDSLGGLAGCRAAPNPPGRQFAIDRYVDYFALPRARGGVKVNPLDVLLYAIDGPENPFQAILSNPGVPAGTPYNECAQLDEMSNPPCVPVLQHSCVGADPRFFGDPAVRLNTVVRSVAQHRIWSICDSDYLGAMRDLAGRVVGQLGGGCLPDDAFAKVTPEAVDCQVTDVAGDVDGAIQTIGRCEAGGTPCWRLAAREGCSGLALTIDRNGAPAPTGSYVSAGCRVR